MGPNDPLPPPSPPGHRHVPPPPVPPAVPQFAPGTEPAAPTIAMPPIGARPTPTPSEPTAPATIPMPVVRDAPAPSVRTGPRRQPAAVVPPATAHRNGTAWIVVGVAVAVVAVVLAAVFALSGGDETVLSAPTTIVAITVPESTAPVTVPVTPAPLIDTTAASTPDTAPITLAPTTTPLEPVVVADDTRVFSVLLLDTFEVRTAPQDVFGGTFASVRGAVDVDAFEDPADRAEFGVQVVVGAAASMPSAADILAQLDPGNAACADRTVDPAYALQSGPATLQMLDACGADQASAQVDLVFEVGDRRVVVHSKGATPANTDLVDFAQAVAESIVLF